MMWGSVASKIARYESGENIPNIVMLGKLAKALGCKVSDFLDGERDGDRGSVSTSVALWMSAAWLCFAMD